MNKFSRPDHPAEATPEAPAAPPQGQPSAAVIEAEASPDPRLITRFASSGG